MRQQLGPWDALVATLAASRTADDVGIDNGSGRASHAAVRTIAPNGDRPALRVLPYSRTGEIVALRAQGLTLAEIGRRHGVSRQRIAQIIDKSDVGRVPRPEVVKARRAAKSGKARRHSEEIMELWREGLSVGEIHERAGVPWRVVRETVAELATDPDRAARSNGWRSNLSVRPPRFSDEQLLDGLRRVANKLGHPPSGPEYARQAEELGLACMQTMYVRFGGWRRALHAAGFEAPPARVWSPRWNIASCWHAFASVAHLLGDPPRYRRYLELAAGREDLPSGSTLILRLGLWPEIVAALSAHARANGAASREEAAA